MQVSEYGGEAGLVQPSSPHDRVPGHVLDGNSDRRAVREAAMLVGRAGLSDDASPHQAEGQTP